ncbi:MAG: hypothetical protein ABW123_11625 [Cystobacter sp.]
MPTNYNGNPAGLLITDNVTVSNPNDGEGGTAASNDVAIKKLADFTKLGLNKTVDLALNPIMIQPSQFTGVVYTAGTPASVGFDTISSINTNYVTAMSHLYIPKGSTISAVRVAVRNLDSVARTVVLQLIKRVYAPGGSFTDTYVTNPGTSVPVTGATTTWVDLVIQPGGPHVSDGLFGLILLLPQTTSNFQFVFYAARIVLA